jgi:hypothetical protein
LLLLICQAIGVAFKTLADILYLLSPLIVALECFTLAGFIVWKYRLLPKRIRKVLENVQKGMPTIVKSLFNGRRNRIPHAKPIQEKIDTNQHQDNNDNVPNQSHNPPLVGG